MVSVIVPVYNTEMDYLKKCIDSILLQTYDNFELLIVDDGSKKLCADELDRIAEKDNRIKLWHKENEGVSKARNFALDRAKGKYVCFIDSDDFITECFLKNSVDIMEQGIDLAIGRVKWIKDNKIVHSNFSDKPETDLVIYKQNTNEEKQNNLCRFLLWNCINDKTAQGFQPEIWCKLYRKELIGELRFDEELVIGEDQVFLACYVAKCSSLGLSNQHWYNYMVYENSSLNREDTKKVEKYIKYFNKMSNALSQNGFDNLNPEKTYFTMRECVAISLGNDNNRNYDNGIYALKKFVKNKKAKQYLKRIPFNSKYLSRIEIFFIKIGIYYIHLDLIKCKLAAMVRNLKG